MAPGKPNGDILPTTSEAEDIAERAAEKAVRALMVKCFGVDPDRSEDIRLIGDDMRWVREQRARSAGRSESRMRTVYAVLGGMMLAFLTYATNQAVAFLVRAGGK